MQPGTSQTQPDQERDLAQYSLLDALRGRRSRRFGMGMEIPDGPFAYRSEHPPLPLLQAEEAALAFAACGITGYALADLSYGAGQGGGMLAGLLGRTVSSGDAINCVTVFVTNDEATYLLKRPQDFAPQEYPALLDLVKQGALTELYERSRVKIADGRATASLQPGHNFNINRWSLYAPGGTYFLPVNEMTHIYINAMLEAFEPEMGIYVLDERAQFRPAGIGKFARSKGGHLYDNLSEGRAATVQALETVLMQGLAIEQGMMLQNLGLMSQALGLGGFPNFAVDETGWAGALGFRLEQLPASRFLGAGTLVRAALRATRRDRPISFPVGLERDGEVLLKPFCPPYYPTMRDAVLAVLEYKFGPKGTFREGAALSGWQEPAASAERIPAPSQKAVEATIAYCEYLYARYGRFPVHSPPFRTVLGYQATHVDPEFYDRFFRPKALTETQRDHLRVWHGE